MAESVESPGRRRLTPPAVGARPGQRGRPGLPARAGARRAGIGPSGSGGRAKAAAFIRRHRLGPYLLLLPSLIGIGLVLLWPTIQVGILSFQNFGLGQLSGAPPTQWVGFSNFTNVLTDGEFWLALRITVVFAAVVVSLTLLVGTAVGVLLLSIIWDFGVFTQTYLITGELGNRDEYNLSLYAYDKAFQMPPSYGLGAALALILTVILLMITVGYVRASVRQGAIS